MERKKVLIYGAGGGGKRIFRDVDCEYEVVGFIDSDERKWGSKLMENEVYPPDRLDSKDYDYVIVASLPGYDAIVSVLDEKEIDRSKVISSYVRLPLESRKEFLRKFAEICDEELIEGCCAEAGVFEGDFAKEINLAFPKRKLYLFDTFEGFREEDILREEGLSNARIGDYSLTSEEVVIKKMKNPQNVIIRKGYFPETAVGINDHFCFVNLDLDLYLPTLNGLKFFEDKMSKNGIILIHDYFSETFQGPKNAVDEYLSGKNYLHKAPIGDGISIMIVGY